MPPVFIFISDLTACHPDWQPAVTQVEALINPLTAKLGFTPRLRLASLPVGHPLHQSHGSGEHLADVLLAEAEAGSSADLSPSHHARL